MEVYRVVNMITGKSYIGKTTVGYLKRMRKHELNALNKVNRRLYDSMNHHGFSCFIVGVLSEHTSIDELNKAEISAIEEFNSLIPNGYNMTLGGDGGYTLSKWSTERRENLYKQQALTRTGVKRTTEQRERMSQAQQGKIISVEQREQVSKKLSDRYIVMSDEDKLKVVKSLMESDYSRKGTTHTPKSKQLMSEAHKGKSHIERYGIEEANRKYLKAKQVFTDNNPRAYTIEDSVKSEVIDLVDSNNTMRQISSITGVSLYKIRQILKEVGITNLQKHKGTDRWKKKNENWLLSEK